MTVQRQYKWWEVGNDGTVTHRTYEDVEPDIEYAKHLREQKGPKGSMFRKGTFHHAAHIPPSIITKILAEEKVNFFDKNDLPKFMKILKEKYPAFITVPHNVLKGK